MASGSPLLASSIDMGSKGPPHQQSPPHTKLKPLTPKVMSFDRGSWGTDKTRPVSSYSTGSYGWDKKPSSQPPTEEDKDAPSDQTSESGDPTPITKSACLRCRGKKSRCSGQRPTCQTCRNSNLDCVWDADAPESSSQPVKRKSRSSADISKQGRSKRTQGPPLQVRSACTRCQKRKAKCTGQRPTCQYCLDRNLDCVYEVEDGWTRTEDLKKKLLESRGETKDFRELFEMLRNSTDHEATTMLARLRLGHPMQDLFEAVRNALSPTDSA